MKKNNTKITAVILSGGQGSRMGNKDKGLLLLKNKPLVQHVIDHVVNQVDEIILSCNRNGAEYSKFGYPIVSDILPDFPGPLAGILSAQSKITMPLCFITACDTPYLPSNIVTQLLKHLKEGQAVTASVNGRLQPLTSIIRTESIASIKAYLSTGNRSVRGWLESIDFKIIDITDEQHSFRNINTAEDLDGQQDES